MKQVQGYEVIFRRCEKDMVMENFSMCASKNKSLCEKFIKHEANGWYGSDYDIITYTHDFIVMSNGREEIELEILQTTILE